MTLARQLDTEQWMPTRDRILAVQYTRPSRVGSIHLPESYDKDGTWNWWECVTAGPDVERKLGIALLPGDIFRTPWRPAIDLGAEDAAGRRLFIVACTVQKGVMVDGRQKMVEELNVNGVIPRTWSDDT